MTKCGFKKPDEYFMEKDAMKYYVILHSFKRNANFTAN